MLDLGGSSNSQSSVITTLDFNPIFNMGAGSETTNEKTFEASQTATQRTDDSLGLSASVGVGVGGDGSGGTATNSRIQDEQPMGTAIAGAQNLLGGINKTYLIFGAVGVGVLYFISKKKR